MKRTLRALCFLPLAHCGLSYGQTEASSFNVAGTTIVETQKAIREGRTTCHAVVSGYLARIQAYDQTPIDGLRLNAIVVINTDALAEADACDRNFAATHKLPPLGGIAMLIKDNYDTQGLQTTGGSLAMRGFVPAHDGRAAGLSMGSFVSRLHGSHRGYLRHGQGLRPLHCPPGERDYRAHHRRGIQRRGL